MDSIYNGAFEEIAGLFKDSIKQLDTVYMNLNRSTLTEFSKRIITGTYIQQSNNTFEGIIIYKEDSLCFDFGFSIDFANGYDDPQISSIEFTNCAIFNDGKKIKDLLLEYTDFESNFKEHILNNLEDFNY